MKVNEYAQGKNDKCQHSPNLHITDYGHMVTRSQILYSPKSYPNPKYLENPVKCMKTLAFCRKNGLVMQNHELGVHMTKFGQIMLTKIP